MYKKCRRKTSFKFHLVHFHRDWPRRDWWDNLEKWSQRISINPQQNNRAREHKKFFSRKFISRELAENWFLLIFLYRSPNNFPDGIKSPLDIISQRKICFSIITTENWRFFSAFKFFIFINMSLMLIFN